MAGHGFGVYVHIPFCASRCDYCAFATYSDRDHLMAGYASALRQDIAAAVGSGTLSGATAVFFGGGTPSRLAASDLCRVLSVIPLAKDAEVTVECNPEDVSSERLGAYKSSGVTRISLGVQSSHDHVLSSLGRHHLFDEAQRAARLILQAGFSSWNLDLIFGAAAESDLDWRRTLERVLDLAPPHVSAYALTVERGTPLYYDGARHPQDDVLATRYEVAERTLSARGYEWEEISNWALPGHRCAYNNLIWEGGNYLGFGSAAHSHLDGHRWWNVRKPERYMARVLCGASPMAGEEVLDPGQRSFEAMALALRTAQGVPQDVIGDAPDLEGLIERSAGRVRLTVRGRLLANEVAVRLCNGR
ncbi:MAG: radical SAM family heme chaperone HemW [Acidimicrobiales bacterium]